ncbi:DUF3370 domain-containing protein [Anabaena sp. FACHB-1237]|uniref:DUF3370 domain-containing protein n=1 Tax=Anabaena sp. FACHB-1237 TaxID=2692769 RepID=UPI0016814D75|nr:DUF3370 domain-containing protein [Anabaena sp. FACHB-1237]MBD2136541.1 DUF3370 domain-containing protein [Anabaena sp. FACHB-1237]
MLPILLSLTLAQAAIAPEEILQPQLVRPLPGQLDTIPVFNSNSPEIVLQEGILLSTFPPSGKKVTSAHLNFPLSGRFDMFAHHIAKADPPENLRSLYLGIILHNPSDEPVTVNILQGASYSSQPDAPFISLASLVPNNLGNVFSGPGSRAMLDILRGKRQDIFPPQIIIPPGKSQMLLNLPIPVKGLLIPESPPINGRSTYLRLQSNGKVYAASLAMFAKINRDGSERSPTLTEWQDLLNNGDLSTPRDKVPTPIESNKKPAIYGRVAGISQGSQWRAYIVDEPQSKYLTIPQPGQAFSYPLSSLHGGTLGTNQIQTAPMLVRYPDTAYYAHGNYGVQYSLRLPLYNNTESDQNVNIALQTPIKEDQLSKSGLRFFSPPKPQTFFRGTVRVRYRNDQGSAKTDFFHLVQKRGEMGQPLVSLSIKPKNTSSVEVDFIYPPDASPPQVLTVSTAANN